MSQVRRWMGTAGVIGFVTIPPARRRPHAAYRALRRIDPVLASPVGIWVLSSHSAVAAALRHPGLGSDESKVDFTALRLGPLRRLLDRSGATYDRPQEHDPATLMLRQLMLFRDPPDHTRLRSLVNKAFTPRAVAALESRIEKIVHDRLDAVEARGRMELMSDLAYPIPALVICELIGVPARDHRLISEHAPALAARLDPGPLRSPATRAAANEATEAITRYLDQLIAARRRQPGDDILSALIGAEEAGDRLNHDELVAMTVLLLMAGHETTANLLGNGLLALLRHPDQWDRLKRDPSLDATAVDELMRFDGPIQMAERITLQDCHVGGTDVPKGRIVVLCLAAANRDPEVYADPHRLDVGRDPNPHVGFGGGAHFCLGASLARMEARIALRAIADRLPQVALAERSVAWRPSFTIRGLRRLPLVW